MSTKGILLRLISNDGTHAKDFGIQGKIRAPMFQTLDCPAESKSFDVGSPYTSF